MNSPPGLPSSVLIWMNFYFIVHYRPATEHLMPKIVVPALAIGLAAAAFVSFFIPLVKGRQKTIS